MFFSKDLKRKVLESGLVDGMGSFHLNLYTNDPSDLVVSGEAVNGDFTPPNYPGYAGIDVTWAGSFDDASGDPIAIIEEQVFSGVSVTDPTTIYGVVASASSEATLVAFEVFDEPFVLNDHNFLGVAPSVKLSSLTGETQVRS